MDTPRLYLFIGYPGAGKTTVAQWINERTAAVHLWADQVRKSLFAAPTHSQEESIKLYDVLNARAKLLLLDGQSVIFDTNFNFYVDRQKLREIADAAGAETVIIWMKTPKDVAKQRATHPSHPERNGYAAAMSGVEFERLTDHLEAPHKDEKVIKFDGTKLDKEEVYRQLGL